MVWNEKRFNEISKQFHEHEKKLSDILRVSENCNGKLCVIARGMLDSDIEIDEHNVITDKKVKAQLKQCRKLNNKLNKMLDYAPPVSTNIAETADCEEEIPF